MHRVRRRSILCGLCAVGLKPATVFAQPAATVRRIGFLTLDTADSEASRTARSALPGALKELGYAEGRNLVVEWRYGDGNSRALPALANDLVERKVEVIVARVNDSIRAAMAATRSIPIVMLNGNFPVENGFVVSLVRPGGNVTGTSYLVSTDIYEKQIQLLKELVPATRRIASLRNLDGVDSAVGRSIEAALDRSAGRLGMTMHYFGVRRPEDVSGALDAIAASGIKALWYQGGPILRARSDQIMAFLRDRRIAAIATIPTFAEAGGLAHYSPDGRDYFVRTASFVDRILKGVQPSELPVEQPVRYEFVVNLKTAQLLGITIPNSLAAQIDRLVE